MADASPQGDKLLNDLVKMLKEHAVGDFVIAFRDPDSLCDVSQWRGSRFWRLGFAMDMADEARGACVSEEKDGGA